VSVTGAANIVVSKQVKYYTTDNLNTDELTKTSVVLNIDKQAPTFTFANAS
jgi:hypothetical protein